MAHWEPGKTEPSKRAEGRRAWIAFKSPLLPPVPNAAASPSGDYARGDPVARGVTKEGPRGGAVFRGEAN